MGRTYQALLEDAEELETSHRAVWDLDEEAQRLGLNLHELLTNEQDWDRTVHVAYRRAALRAHPDKFPAAKRDQAEEAFKLLKGAQELILKVGKAVREEVEGGGVGEAEKLRQRARVEKEDREQRQFVEQLDRLTSLDGLHQGQLPTKCMAPKLRTGLDFQEQFWGLLAQCKQEVIDGARRRRRRRWLRRILIGAAAVAALWMWGSKRAQKRRERGELTEAEIRAAMLDIRRELRRIARRVAKEVGDPGRASEYADVLEQAFLDGRLQIGEDGSLEFDFDEYDYDDDYEYQYANYMGLGGSEDAQGGPAGQLQEDGVVYCGGGEGRIDGI